MKRFIFNLLVLLVLITSLASKNKNVGLVKDRDKNGFSVTRSFVPPADPQKPELFKLQPEHPAYRLDGCIVRSESANSLSFEFKKPGRSVLILRATAPLIVSGQYGLTALLRPGWDGTLGYSLYALDIEAGVIGSGRVNLDVVPVPAGDRQNLITFNARASRFPFTPPAFHKWQLVWRDKLTGRLMNGGFPAKVPPEAEVMETIDRPSFTLRRIRYKTQPDRSNTLLLSLPRNSSDRVPLLIALHGHESTWGEADTGAFTMGHPDDFCAFFAERGWAVLEPATMNHTLQHPGWTLQGEWTWDAMAALDYVISLPQVNTGQVMVCGLSTGGHLAMNMLALDDRIRAGVIGCVLSTWHHYRERMRIPPHCDCGILGQLGDWLEQCDWAAIAAPKPVQFQHGRQDAGFCPGADPSLLDPSWNTTIMPEEEFSAAFGEVERAYRLSGGEHKANLHIHNDGHHVDAEAAYLFLMSVIRK